MSIKIYKKRGAANYKERALLKQLEPALEKLATEDPAFINSFKSAETFDELKALHSQYCIDEAEIISETPNATMAEKTNETTSTGDSSIKFQNPETPLEDPMNRANPIIREHVLNDTFSAEGASKRPDIGGQPNLDEPKSYEEAFKLPDEELDPKERREKQKAEAEANKTASGNNGGGNNSTKKPSDSVNPAFDDMSQQRKNKQTKRFAKYIVEFFAMGLEMGYMWFVTKDINDLKIAEYELKDKIDPSHLELVMNLTEEQEITIRAFFQMQCAQAQVNAKVSDDDKSELADALADVLMEKGFAPTPMQSLMMVMGQIIAAKAIPAFVQVQQNNSILNQLFTMRADQKKEQGEVVQHAVRETTASASSNDNDNDTNSASETYHENAHKEPESTELTVTSKDENARKTD